MASSEVQFNALTTRGGYSASSTLYDLSNTSQCSRQFACLYTKHKTQKRQVWHDGRLVLQSASAILHNANPAPGSADPPLDECEVSTHQINALLQGQESRLETDKFFIQVEGPWVVVATTTLASTSTISTKRNSAPRVSSSMQKILNRKFQKPKAYVPPHPSIRPDRLHAVLGKRRRPLQPGELDRINHGANGVIGQSENPPQSQTMPPPMTNNRYQAQPQAPLTRDPVSYPRPPQNRFQTPPMSNQHLEPSRRQPPPPNLSPLAGYNSNPNPNRQDYGNEGPSPAPQTPQNNINGAPDAFVLPPPQHQHPHPQDPPPRNQNLLDFVSNEFSATSFYGLEEEEEEQDQQEGEWQAQPWAGHTGGGESRPWEPSTRNRDCATTATGDDQCLQASVRDDAPDTFREPTDHDALHDNPSVVFQVPEREEAPNNKVHQAPVQHEETTASSTKNSRVTSNQLLALFGAVPTIEPVVGEPSPDEIPATEDSDHPVVTNEENASAGFFLPQASQSSSDDSEEL